MKPSSKHWVASADAVSQIAVDEQQYDLAVVSSLVPA